MFGSRLFRKSNKEPVRNEFAYGEEKDEGLEEGDFARSLDELSADDIVLNETAARKKGASVFEWIRRIIFWGSLVVFIGSLVMLAQNLIARQKAKDIYAQLQMDFFSDDFSEGLGLTTDLDRLAKDQADGSLANVTDIRTDRSALPALEVEQKTYNLELEKIRARLTSLAQINPDLYGYIVVDGTHINYPIVQGTDNDYYLNHVYNGDYLPIGSIFVDYRNDKTIDENYNTVIYGHNITSGAMFHDITLFYEEEYMNEKLITIYTMDGIFIYEPFSVYQARSDYNYFKTSFNSAAELVKFAETARENSRVQKDITFTEDDRLLTLSTCTNSENNLRYALHAKLIKVIRD